MPEMKFPIDPPRFVAMPNPTRNRILLIAEPNSKAPTAQQVATLAAEHDIDQLVDALNEAAWTGSDHALSELEAGLPDPVRRSLRQTLSELPPHTAIAVDDAGDPLRVATTLYLRPGTQDLGEIADAAPALGVSTIFENTLDEDGRLLIQATVLTGEADFEADDGTVWWPLPEGTHLTERTVIDHKKLSKTTEDTRWETHKVRAYNAWVPDAGSDQTRTALVVVEYFDALLEPETNFRVFLRADPNEDEVLTERNRFVLWQSLWLISVDLDFSAQEDITMSMVYEDMPRMTRNQPAAWWKKMGAAAEKLCEAARRGDRNRLIPRTPAEEALIALATSEEYVSAARDHLKNLDYEDEFADLPHAEWDDEFDEILPALTGDTDILMLWSDGLDGIEQADNIVNQVLGIGDYQPGTWQDQFSGRQW